MNKEFKTDTLIISSEIGSKTSTNIFGQDCYAQKPYWDKNIIGRLIRGIWFKLGLPEKPWYNTTYISKDIKHISLTDTLLTEKYLNWLVAQCPTADIEFHYGNLVGKSPHVYPNQIPSSIKVITYDPDDAQKYNLILEQGHEFSADRIRKKMDPICDIFYVGADKGRAEYVLELKEQFEKLGLSTKFIITSTNRYSLPKPYYSKRISYDEVLDYDAKTKAILNVIMPGQTGATMRDFEALFMKAKLITNNTHIKEFDFYKPENIFIIGEDDISNLYDFVNSPWSEVDSDILQKHLK